MIQKGNRLSDIRRYFNIRLSFADIILLSAGIFILFINPSYNIFGTGCLFQKLTGYKCAGCGISRGIHSVLHGNFASAAEYNILLVSAIPAAVIYYLSRKCFQTNNISLWNKTDRIMISLFAAIVVIFTITRNI